MCIKFKDFHTNLFESPCIFTKGWCFDSKSKPISDIWFNIIGIEFYNYHDNIFSFFLEYKIKGTEITDTLDAFVSCQPNRNPRITCTPSPDKLLKILKDYGSIINSKTLSSLLKSYIGGLLLKECSVLSNHVFNIGWSSSKDYPLYFMPLESDHSPVKHSVKELLFYDIDDQKSLVSDSFFVKPEYDDSYVSIIRFLCSDRNILSIFAYTLHAISFHAIVSYDSFNKCTQLIKESSIFSICIYGSDTEKSSAAANIFSNLLAFSPSQPKTLLKNSCLSVTSLHAQKYMHKLCYFSSIPFCITAKDHRITRSTTLLKRMQILRERNKLHIYPVFIGTNPINADEVLDFSSDSFTLPDHLSDYKVKLNRLLCDYIIFLQDILNTDRDLRLSNQFRELYNQDKMLDSNVLFHQKGSLTQHYNRFLWLAVTGFCIFLHQNDTLADAALDLFHFAKKHLLNTETITESDVSESFTVKELLLSLYAWLQQEASADSDIAKIDFEKRDTHEQCYYLESKFWYASYSKYCRQHKLVAYPEKKIINALKETSILNVRSESGSLGKYRTFNGKRGYYFILYISRLSKRCHQ